MFSKSLFLAAGLLSASAAFSLPSRLVPGDPAIIPLPSALDVEKASRDFWSATRCLFPKRETKAALPPS